MYLSFILIFFSNNNYCSRTERSCLLFSVITLNLYIFQATMCSLWLFVCGLLALHHFSKGLTPTETARSQQDSSTVLAFSAQLSDSTVFMDGSTIVYDTTQLNEGGVYNNTSGEFTCPDNALYVFTWTLDKHHFPEYSERCSAALRVGDNQVKYGPKTNHVPFYASGCTLMTAVAQCRASVPSSVAFASAADNNPEGYLYLLRTKFSAFRLVELSNSDVAAFTVELSEDKNIAPGSRLIFDQTVRNYGEHYNTSDGSFHCPMNGTYVFTITTQTPYYPGGLTHVWTSSRLVVDGEIVVLGPLTHAARENHDSGSSSITVALQLEEGQDVHVEANEAYRFDLNSYGAELTSFTGFFLDSSVAFSAVMTQNQTNTWNTTLDKVVTNVGEAYNATTGVFTCPDDDVYMFTWGGANDIGGPSLFLELYVNGSPFRDNVYTSFTGTNSDSAETSGSNSLYHMMRCTAGTPIYLYCRGCSDKKLVAEYTYFTGYKLPNQEL